MSFLDKKLLVEALKNGTDIKNALTDVVDMDSIDVTYCKDISIKYLIDNFCYSSFDLDIFIELFKYISDKEDCLRSLAYNDDYKRLKWVLENTKTGHHYSGNHFVENLGHKGFRLFGHYLVPTEQNLRNAVYGEKIWLVEYCLKKGVIIPKDIYIGTNAKIMKVLLDHGFRPNETHFSRLEKMGFGDFVEKEKELFEKEKADLEEKKKIEEYEKFLGQIDPKHIKHAVEILIKRI